MKRILTAGLVVLAGCSSARQPVTEVAPAAPAPVTTNQAAIERARADSARYPYTEADVAFMTNMIGHHSQAIHISGWAPTHGASPAVRRLAERIINAQQDEIVTMKQWLVDRQKPMPDEHAHHAHMAGMLSEAQLKALNAARGAEFDRMFLTLMIQHHRGAVQMVRDLMASQGAAQDLTVFKFANDVQVDQSTEVARMEQMLANMPDSSKE